MSYSNLANSGTSIQWSADQILRADIRSGDTVIWGVTSFSRFPYYNQLSDSIQHVNCRELHSTKILKEIYNIDYLNDHTLIYNAVTMINQVNNYCKQIGCTLIIAGLLAETELAIHLKDLPNYIHLHGFYGVNVNDKFIDTGSDNMHPGPLTHKWYADEIIKKLTEIKEIAV
jgi:hypothetical protein